MSQTKKEWTEDDVAKFLLKLLAFYAFCALLTNSYCQVYRYGDWQKQYGPSEATTRLGWATGGWPVYWASKMTMEGFKSLQGKPAPEISGDGLIKLD